MLRVIVKIRLSRGLVHSWFLIIVSKYQIVVDKRIQPENKFAN